MFRYCTTLQCKKFNLCKTVLATKNSSQCMSKIGKVLNGTIPEAFNHIKELNRMNSHELKQKYDKLVQRALAGGGERGIERHVRRNKKMLVRDRIRLLLDRDSETMELSLIAGLDMEYGDVPCAGVVTVIGKVHGIWCMIQGNDATVKSGSIYPITLKKQLRAQMIAKENRLPSIYLVDSGGGFLPKQAEIFNEGGAIFYNEAVMSSQNISQTAVVCGSCTAGAAYIPAMADETVILHKTGTIFLGGPPLVYAATGEKVTAEELGGATLHCKVSGCADHFAETEEEALSKARDIIATLNLSGLTQPSTAHEDPLYDVSRLNDLAPCYDQGCQMNPHIMLSSIVDGSRFHEFKHLFGTTLVTGFGHVKGHLAGFLVSNGRLTGPAAMKGSHFVQLCSQRGIPLVFLQHFDRDTISSPHKVESYDAISNTFAEIKHHAQLIQAVACATVPSVAIATGGVIGSVESHALGSLSMGSRFQFVYPNVRVGGYHPRDMLLEEDHHPAQPKDDISGHKRTLEAYQKYHQQTESFYASARLFNDGVILPHDTRDVLAICLDIFRQKTSHEFQNKNLSAGNQPVIKM
ncbi:unnamed protein product [Clavelina lepadiformis]|uniref:methylcrotonoyl-CoA carboxylase n=1 Tax=Clavelina lepadiformis TaxID=159417 RepID=A0ABP0F903_CLALP